MLSNLRIFPFTRNFVRTFSSEKHKIPKKYDLFEQDEVKEVKSVLQKELDKKESWNSPEEQEEQEKKERKLTERQQKIEDDKERLKWVPPVEDDKKNFRTKFAAFASDRSDSSFLEMMAQPWDWSPATLKKRLNRFSTKRQAYLQQYIPERMEKLGPDLATAHFILFRGGKVKFKGDTDYFTNDMVNDLPTLFDPKYMLEELVYDNYPLFYEGVENIRDLAYLKSISLKNSPYFDDFCLDRLSGNNLPALETLDLRGCTNITYKSMTCIYRLRGLKKLLLSTSDLIEWKLSAAMLEEMKPDLSVIVEETPSKEAKVNE